jgi:DNA-binding NtrC family response regulator
MLDEHHLLHPILQVLGGFTNTSIFSLTTWCPVGHRILVVDDEPALRTILARAFRQRGCETLEACDEVAALKAALSASPPFDLVVTNSRMRTSMGFTWPRHCTRQARGCRSCTSSAPASNHSTSKTCWTGPTR